MTLDELVGQQVRALRRSRDLSQRELADAINAHGGLRRGQAHHTSVQRIERGAQPLHLAELFTVALALGVPPLRLLLPTAGEVVAVAGEVELPPWSLLAWAVGLEPLPSGVDWSDRDARDAWRDASLPLVLWWELHERSYAVASLMRRVERPVERREDVEAQLARELADLDEVLGELKGLGVPVEAALPPWLEPNYRRWREESGRRQRRHDRWRRINQYYRED